MPIIVTPTGSTAQTLIDRALRLLGQIGSGESPTADETADCLLALNAMIDSWRNEKLMCYASQDESIGLSSGNTTRTIGYTGNLVSTRPVRIDAAYIIYSSTSIPVMVISDEEYAAIPDKTSTSDYPDRIYYEPSMPNGTIYMYPLPSATSTLHVITWTPVTSFADATTVVSLPPGWEEALATNLALKIAPEFETVAGPDLREAAREAKSNIKKINTQPIKSFSELGVLLGRRRSNIITDQP